jgi:hypothetical protein
MTVVIPLLLLYAFMAWPGISLIFGSLQAVILFYPPRQVVLGPPSFLSNEYMWRFLWAKAAGALS